MAFINVEHKNQFYTDHGLCKLKMATPANEFWSMLTGVIMWQWEYHKPVSPLATCTPYSVPMCSGSGCPVLSLVTHSLITTCSHSALILSMVARQVLGKLQNLLGWLWHLPQCPSSDAFMWLVMTGITSNYAVFEPGPRSPCWLFPGPYTSLPVITIKVRQLLTLGCKQQQAFWNITPMVTFSPQLFLRIPFLSVT